MIVVSESGEKHYVYKLGETMTQVKEEIFLLTLENNNWNRLRTARALGLHYRTVRLWIRKLKDDGRPVPASEY